MKHASASAGELQRRFFGTGSKPAVDTESRTCELSFSSTAPVERSFGIEVLSHAPGAADLSRLNGSAPLLFNHDSDDILGVVERAFISGDKGRAMVRFGRDARGEWAMQQAADGVLVNVSFAYRVVGGYRQARTGELIADAWEALEISLVTVAADKTVGIGRSIHLFTPNRKFNMPHANHEQARPSRSQRAFQAQNDEAEDNFNATERERARVLEIAAMGRKHDISADLISSWQQRGASVDEARMQCAEIVMARAQAMPNRQADFDGFDASSGIGMGRKDTDNFSVVRAIRAMVTNDWRKAGLEREASHAVARSMGRDTEGFFVPLEVMQQTPWQTRAPYLVGTALQGGNLVQTELAVDYFVEALRNASQVINAGATILSGLVGNVDIPRRASATATYWVAESGAITEAEATFDKISLRPKTLGALSKMSRMTLMQATPAIEALTRSDMMLQLGLGLDLAALSGTGTGNQPLGVIGTAGIGSVVGGTNGAAVTLDNLIQLETQIANANGPTSSRAYMLNTKTIATLKTLKSSTGQYLWTTDAPGQRSGTPPSFGGYPVFPTNQLRSNLTKGTSGTVCSELVFGAWDELVIGQWGVLEIVANPYDTGFAAGDVTIRAMQTVDIQVRHAASFAVMSDALTP